MHIFQAHLELTFEWIALLKCNIVFSGFVMVKFREAG